MDLISLARRQNIVEAFFDDTMNRRVVQVCVVVSVVIVY